MGGTVGSASLGHSIAIAIAIDRRTTNAARFDALAARGADHCDRRDASVGHPELARLGNALISRLRVTRLRVARLRVTVVREGHASRAGAVESRSAGSVSTVPSR